MSAQVHISQPVEGVAQLLMDNGPRNFANPELHTRLLEALIEVRGSGSRVVVLGSAIEGFFISHGHIGSTVEMATGAKQPDGDPRAFLGVQKELDTGPMVSIAAIEGQAWGGGAELAWACDFRVASENSTIGQPEVMLGLPPAGGATRIARLAGEAAAKRIVLDGRPVLAPEAHRLGLVDRIVLEGTALNSALDWAIWLAGRAPGDLSMVKELIVGGRELDRSTALKRETTLFLSRFQDGSVVDRAMAAQQRYDQGADSFEAFGIPTH